MLVNRGDACSTDAMLAAQIRTLEHRCNGLDRRVVHKSWNKNWPGMRIFQVKYSNATFFSMWFFFVGKIRPEFVLIFSTVTVIPDICVWKSLWRQSLAHLSPLVWSVLFKLCVSFQVLPFMICPEQIGGAAAIVRQYLMDGFYPTVMTAAHICSALHQTYVDWIMLNVCCRCSEIFSLLNLTTRGNEIRPTLAFHRQAQVWCGSSLRGVLVVSDVGFPVNSPSRKWLTAESFNHTNLCLNLPVKINGCKFHARLKNSEDSTWLL